MNPFGVKMERGSNTGTYFTGPDAYTAMAAAVEWFMMTVQRA